MNKILILLCSCVAVLLSACDSGNIEEETSTAAREGLSIRLTGRLRGADTWSDRYQLVLAAFAPGSDYTLVQKEIPSQLLDGDSVNFVLGGIPAEAEKVQLCVVDRVRERVATFADFKLNAKMFERTRDTLRFEVGRANVGMYSVVEEQLFDNLCSKCHGNNGRDAAAMDLRKGHAYASTVGVASRLNPAAQRIVPDRPTTVGWCACSPRATKASPTTETTRSFSTMSVTASILRSSKIGSTPERNPNFYETARGQIAFSRRVFQNNGLFAKNLGRNRHKLWTFFSYLPTLPERVPRSTPRQPTKRGFRPTICAPSAWFRACLRRIVARRCAPCVQTLLRERRHQPSSVHGVGNGVHRLRRSAAAARRF